MAKAVGGQPRSVRWTPKAIATYIDVLKYLRKEWTAREEQRFVDEVEDTIRYIVLFPKGFRSAGHARLREAPVKPYNILL
jgi:plasmid stabilization system protein ParE